MNQTQKTTSGTRPRGEGLVDKLKASLRIEDEVQKYVELQPRGSGRLVGRCPLGTHTDSTPSFTVYTDTQTFHCYGCGGHGDVLNFLAMIRNEPLSDVIREEAERLGISTNGHTSPLKPYQQVLEKLVAVYMEQLAKSPKAIKYLKSRGVKRETAELFSLGYAGPQPVAATWPDKHERELLKELGYIVESRNGRERDQMRDRLIIPIRHGHKIVGIAGRDLSDGNGRAGGRKPAKYLNSKSSALFNKRALFFTSPDMNILMHENTVVIAEGYFDVILARQLGIRNVMATMGVSISPQHIDTLRRMKAERITLAYDADEAGWNGILRTARALLETWSGFDVRVALLPEMDMDELAVTVPDLLDVLLNGPDGDGADYLVDAIVKVGTERGKSTNQIIRTCIRYMSLMDDISRIVNALRLSDTYDIPSARLIAAASKIASNRNGKERKPGPKRATRKHSNILALMRSHPGLSAVAVKELARLGVNPPSWLEHSEDAPEAIEISDAILYSLLRERKAELDKQLRAGNTDVIDEWKRISQLL